jgi:putative SOS response-associated peptidase YedK
MCGRFASKETKEKLAKRYHARKVTNAAFTPSHNIAPTELAPIIFEDEELDRHVELANFGITMTNGPMLNARSESFSKWAHILTRRCIIPANGFYEWIKLDDGSKQPYYFNPKDDLFSFAGLWRPQDKGFAFSILTTSANDLVKPVHERMPVILGHNTIPVWLNPDTDNATLTSLLQPYPADLMQVWQVAKTVNSPKNKHEACIAKLS